MVYCTLLCCILHYRILHCINIAHDTLVQCINVGHYLDFFSSDNQSLPYFFNVTKILSSDVFPVVVFRYFPYHQMDSRSKLITDVAIVLIPRLKSYYAYATIMDYILCSLWWLHKHNVSLAKVLIVLPRQIYMKKSSWK